VLYLFKAHSSQSRKKCIIKSKATVDSDDDADPPTEVTTDKNVDDQVSPLPIALELLLIFLDGRRRQQLHPCGLSYH